MLDTCLLRFVRWHSVYTFVLIHMLVYRTATGLEGDLSLRRYQRAVPVWIRPDVRCVHVLAPGARTYRGRVRHTGRVRNGRQRRHRGCHRGGAGLHPVARRRRTHACATACGLYKGCHPCRAVGGGDVTRRITTCVCRALRRRHQQLAISRSGQSRQGVEHRLFFLFLTVMVHRVIPVREVCFYVVRFECQLCHVSRSVLVPLVPSASCPELGCV